MTIQSHANLENGLSSLLVKDIFLKFIWREAQHEQKRSLEKAVLRMLALNSKGIY